MDGLITPRPAPAPACSLGAVVLAGAGACAGAGPAAATTAPALSSREAALIPELTAPPVLAIVGSAPATPGSAASELVTLRPTSVFDQLPCEPSGAGAFRPPVGIWLTRLSSDAGSAPGSAVICAPADCAAADVGLDAAAKASALACAASIVACPWARAVWVCLLRSCSCCWAQEPTSRLLGRF